MSDAIEVLKKGIEYVEQKHDEGYYDEKIFLRAFHTALDEALLALEQKEEENRVCCICGSDDLNNMIDFANNYKCAKVCISCINSMYESHIKKGK